MYIIHCKYRSLLQVLQKKKLIKNIEGDKECTPFSSLNNKGLNSGMATEHKSETSLGLHYV
jgi:hypothetical protein